MSASHTQASLFDQPHLFSTNNAAGTAYRVGIPEGTSAAQRRRWNSNALEMLKLLNELQRAPTTSEQTVLALYSGEGGIGKSLYEYYTPNEISAAVWGMLRRLHPNAKTVLEPSAATGALLQDAPAHLHITAVELHDTSHSILKRLYPNATTYAAPLEKCRKLLDQYDLIVGNPPFGPREEYSAFDEPGITDAAAYFFKASIDLLATNGVLALVLPTGITSNQNMKSIRAYAHKHCETIAIFGLPTDAFHRSQCTIATTDLVIMRKRSQPSNEPNPTFVDGHHFRTHPDMRFGLEEQRPFRNNTITVRSGSLEQALRGIEQFAFHWNSQSGIQGAENQTRPTAVAKPIPAKGSIRDADTKPQRWTGTAWQDLEAEQANAIKHALDLEKVLGTYHSALSVAPNEVLRQTCATLLQEYRTRHGAPEAALKGLNEPLPYLRNAYDGEKIAIVYDEPLVAKRIYDMGAIAAVVLFLKSKQIPATLEKIDKHYRPEGLTGTKVPQISTAKAIAEHQAITADAVTCEPEDQDGDDGLQTLPWPPVSDVPAQTSTVKGRTWPVETQTRRRGHAFYPIHQKDIPTTYGQEKLARDQQIAHVKYFGGAFTYYLIEIDPDGEVGFGWTIGLEEQPELGSVSLTELETLHTPTTMLSNNCVRPGIVIERDLHFKPTPVGEIQELQRRFGNDLEDAA